MHIKNTPIKNCVDVNDAKTNRTKEVADNPLVWFFHEIHWMAPLVLVFVLAFLLGLQQIHSPDLGFHLRSGEWIINNYRFPYQEMFGYTVLGARYIDLYWLYQILQVFLERLGGMGLIIIFNAVLILTSLVITTIRTYTRSSVQMILLPLILLLGIFVLTFETRPQVLSWAFLSIILLLLERYTRKENPPLWSIPIIMIFWVNVHPLAILGLVILCAFLTGEYLKKRQVDKILVRITVLSAAAFLVTPYFIRGLSIPLQQFGFLQSGNVFKSAISEYISPFTLSVYRSDGGPFFLQSAFPYHLFSIIAVFAAILCLRGHAWTDFILIVVFLYVFALAIKNFGYFFLTASPIIIHRMQSIRMERNSHARKRMNKPSERIPEPFVRNVRARNAFALVANLLACITLVSVFSGAWSVFWKSDMQFGLVLDPLHVPYRAIAFLNEKGLDGRIFNDISSGGWLMKFWKGQVFIDGRNEVYGDQFLRKVLETYRSPRKLEAILAEYHPQIALFDYMKSPQWLAFFIGRKDWRLTYADDHSVVWLKNGYADEILTTTVSAGYDTLRPIPPVLETIHKDYPIGFAAFYASLTCAQYYPWSEYQESILASQMGWYEEAERLALEGLHRSTVPNLTLLFNLGHVLYRRGNIEGARASYLRILEFKDDAEVRQRLLALNRY